MILGHDYWVWIWGAILGLGILGFVPALQWGRQTHWKNLDELLRGAGTILCSAGMLLLLQGWVPPLGYGLLFLALVCFGAAFALGRRDQKREPPSPPFQQ